MEVKNKETITNLPILLCDKCKCVPLIKFTTPENSDIRIKYTCRCGEKDNTLSECFSMLSNNQMKIEEDNCKTCEKGNAEHFCEKCKKTFCVQCEYKHFEHKIIKEDVLMNYIRTEKRKEFNTKSMSEEEAILQMEMLGHDFFIYKDSETSKVCVLYKRKDNNYGLIETN